MKALHETENARERAFLLVPQIKSRQGESLRSKEQQLEEIKRLAQALELGVVGFTYAPLPSKHPSTFVGSGKVEEIKQALETLAADLVIVDDLITAAQQRNLERAWSSPEQKVRVIDRTWLILEIFSSRARTKEAVLQVALAKLSYQRSHLVRSWTHLERQRGASGTVGGAGEKQIELDKRMIDEKILSLKEELAHVSATRALHRKKRMRTPYPVVALVGYTNAGKSTLFNAITHDHVLAKDMLFATLDPTLRLVSLPSRKKVIFSDTVGFVSRLPTTLIAAFKATLEEVLEADLILHVEDIASADKAAQKQDVILVLQELGIKLLHTPPPKGTMHMPHEPLFPWGEETMRHKEEPARREDARETLCIEVFNKADLLTTEDCEATKASVQGANAPVLLSAKTGDGLDALLERIDACLANEEEKSIFRMRMEHPLTYKAIAWLHEHADVRTVSYEEEAGEAIVEAFLSAATKGEFFGRFSQAMKREKE